MGAFFSLFLVTDVEPPSLVVGAVAGGSDLGVLALVAAAGHPGFQVVLAVGRPAQVAGGRVDHLVGHFQLVEDPTFQLAEVFQHRVALFGGSEGEHFHLGELMDAKQPARGPAVRAGFGAEAMADAAELERQLLLLKHLPGHQPAQGNLGRGHQAQVGVFDAVDLRLRPPGNEADAL